MNIMALIPYDAISSKNLVLFTRLRFNIDAW